MKIQENFRHNYFFTVPLSVVKTHKITRHHKLCLDPVKYTMTGDHENVGHIMMSLHCVKIGGEYSPLRPMMRVTISPKYMKLMGWEVGTEVFPVFSQKVNGYKTEEIVFDIEPSKRVDGIPADFVNLSLDSVMKRMKIKAKKAEMRELPKISENITPIMQNISNSQFMSDIILNKVN